MQSALIVAQVAVSVVLLVGGGPAASELLPAAARRPRLPRRPRAVGRGLRQLLEVSQPAVGARASTCRCSKRLESSPGVVSAAVTNGVPLSGVQPGQTRFQIRGVTYENPDVAPTADIRVASPRYFDTLAIPMRGGRAFTELDHEEARTRRHHQRIDGAVLGRTRSDRR